MRHSAFLSGKGLINELKSGGYEYNTFTKRSKFQYINVLITLVIYSCLYLYIKKNKTIC